MFRMRVPFAIVACAISFFVHADDPLGDAMKRGLINKPATSQRPMNSAQWNRQQSAALEKSESIMHRATQESGLLAQYEFMRAHYDKDDNRIFRLVFGQYLSWFQTWIGDYDAARISFSLAQPAQHDDAPSPLDNGFHARPAADAILELTRDRKAVFFNESHGAPLTRTLTLELLEKLRAQGFDYFAAETLTSSPPPNSYPTARGGFYVNEPLCAELLRTAQRLGFHVIAYDAEENAPDARERIAAQSLYDQVFKKNPNARLIVNAGFSHIQKSGDHVGGPSMAEIFQKLSGIDPLSVEQTMMIEHPQSGDDHPYFRAAMATSHPDEPFVFTNDAGQVWTLKPSRYDVTVFFPAEKRIDGRPDWLSLGHRRKGVEISGADCAQKFPCLIEAHYADEGSDAVAADRVEFESDSRSRLYLFPGAYRLSAMDLGGKIFATRNIDVVMTNPARGD